MYVKSPAMRAKNEYQSLVSPIVLRGGLSRLIQRPVMNASITAMDNDVKVMAYVLFLR